MPFINFNGARLHYEETGTGPQTIVFGHSLLLHLRMYDKQVAHFKDRYRCLTMDFRGQGQSEITENGYDMDTLAEDMAALIREKVDGPCHYVGLSMGGFVGLRIAIKYPELFRSLSLLDTAAKGELPSNLPRYQMLLRVAKLFGTWIVTSRVMKIMFGPEFLSAPETRPIKKYWAKEMKGYDRKGLIPAIEAVLARKEVHESDLAKIKAPTQILVGELDQTLPVPLSEHLHQHIPDSSFHLIPNAGHIIAEERPDEVNTLLDSFIQKHS